MKFSSGLGVRFESGGHTHLQVLHFIPEGEGAGEDEGRCSGELLSHMREL